MKTYSVYCPVSAGEFDPIWVDFLSNRQTRDSGPMGVSHHGW